ncbi:hypothetical protein GF325_01360, partial [Candidatus Bathyarchaeota archaeon]|nr:hypothetical protein [Candidatus Bathyarchaeota archaeon]
MNQLVENGAGFSIDTQVFINRNKTLGHLGTRDLINASILGIMGGFISSLVPFSLLVKIWYPFAGGTQLVSGHHLIWMVIAYGLVNKKAAILVTAFIKGMCEMLLGDQWGIIILLINLLEGISLSAGFWLMERLGEGTTKLGWGLAGGLGNFSQAPVFWLMTGRIFILDISLAILAFIFAFVSGCLLSGIFGRFIVLKVREGSLYSFKKYVECHQLGGNYDRKASRRLEWTGDFQKDMESINKCMAYPRNGSHENGSVVIDHVSFTYHGSNSPILARIESQLQQGDTCIITGP